MDLFGKHINDITEKEIKMEQLKNLIEPNKDK